MFSSFRSFIHQDPDEGEISYKLLKANVEVVETEFCNSSSSYEGAMKPGMICAGQTRGGGQDACQGTIILSISIQFI